MWVFCFDQMWCVRRNTFELCTIFFIGRFRLDIIILVIRRVYGVILILFSKSLSPIFNLITIRWYSWLLVINDHYWVSNFRSITSIRCFAEIWILFPYDGLSLVVHTLLGKAEWWFSTEVVIVNLFWWDIENLVVVIDIRVSECFSQMVHLVDILRCWDRNRLFFFCVWNRTIFWHCDFGAVRISSRVIRFDLRITSAI